MASDTTVSTAAMITWPQTAPLEKLSFGFAGKRDGSDWVPYTENHYDLTVMVDGAQETLEFDHDPSRLEVARRLYDLRGVAIGGLQEETEPDGTKVVRAVSPTGVLVDRGRTELFDQTPKIRMEAYLREQYEDWQRWKATREEAQFRPAPANVITALTNRENNAWSAYVAAINEWRLM